MFPATIDNQFLRNGEQVEFGLLPLESPVSNALSAFIELAPLPPPPKADPVHRALNQEWFMSPLVPAALSPFIELAQQPPPPKPDPVRRALNQTWFLPPLAAPPPALSAWGWADESPPRVGQRERTLMIVSGGMAVPSPAAVLSAFIEFAPLPPPPKADPVHRALNQEWFMRALVPAPLSAFIEFAPLPPPPKPDPVHRALNQTWFLTPLAPPPVNPAVEVVRGFELKFGSI